MGTAAVVLSSLVAIVLMWAVLSPRVRDGVITKLGLICMALGHASLAVQLRLIEISDADPAVRGAVHAALLLSAGGLVVALSILWRLVHPRHPKRRRSDWIAAADSQRQETRP